MNPSTNVLRRVAALSYALGLAAAATTPDPAMIATLNTMLSEVQAVRPVGGNVAGADQVNISGNGATVFMKG